MDKQLVLSFLILFFAIVIVVCFIVIFRGRKKITSKLEEDLLQRDLEIKAFRESTYVLRVPMNKEAEGCIQLAQVRTQAESPEHVACDALMFYTAIVERYSRGYKLFFSTPSGPRSIRFEPLDSVMKKIES